MNKRIIFLLTILFSLNSCYTNIYVVRHAEKATQPSDNPPLTEIGEARAARLATILADKNVQKIFSTATLRTESTAKPLANRLKISIENYNAKDQTVFIETLKQSYQNTLVVGHSNSIVHVINGLAEKTVLSKSLDETEYDNLFCIKRPNVKGFGKIKCIQKKY